jgi:Zn-dependent protease with chaperone function
MMLPRVEGAVCGWVSRGRVARGCSSLVSAVIALTLGCESSSSRSAPPPAYPAYAQPGGAAQYPPGQYPQQQYPQQYPQQQYPQQQYPQQQYPQQQPAVPVPAVPLPSVVSDPINELNVGWLRQQAQSILNELVAALPDGPRGRVQGIPLAVDDTVGEVNAFAACSQGRSLMAITDGLLEIMAWLAMASATDQVFGGNKTDEYIRFIASHLEPGKPIPRPAGLLTAATQADGRKVQRQHALFEEETAFVLGHELAHHHLGHLPCTGQAGVLGSGDLLRMLSQNVPVFNQPNEGWADVAGTSNVLDAGARRSVHWSEQGGLLTMRFFLGLEGGFNLLVAFRHSHPSPTFRIPFIQQSADYWRRTGGQSMPVPRIGG